MDLQYNPIDYDKILTNLKNDTQQPNLNTNVNNGLYIGRHYNYETSLNFWGRHTLKNPYDTDLHCVPNNTSQSHTIPLMRTQSIQPHFT